MKNFKILHHYTNYNTNVLHMRISEKQKPQEKITSKTVGEVGEAKLPFGSTNLTIFGTHRN